MNEFPLENSESTETGTVRFTLSKYFLMAILLISAIMILIRVLLYFFNLGEYITETKDIDYKILMEGMDNGLINFYDPITISEYPPYYLYFWYFMFYPMYLIPIPIGVYVWDVLRILSCGLVIKKAPNLFENTIDLIIFYILCCVGYSLDAYFNNVNFLILFFLFYSYYFWKGDSKYRGWISGLLFALACFKINSILFFVVLLLVKRNKLKDLVYFILPIILLSIPYMIFPNYFFQMINNWSYGSNEVESTSIIMTIIMTMDSVAWKALQPSHLMFIGLVLIVFLENIKEEKWRSRYRIILLTILAIYNVRLLIVLFFVPVVLS